jgi:SAM-dependent methyltransferase
MKSADIERLYYDGRHYDLQFKSHICDIPFYLRQVKKYGGPVLELACGTGRIAIPLAEEGFQIVGLDVSTSMLSEGRRKAVERRVQVEWVEADCRSFRLGRKFKLILFPFTTIALLHDLESVEACFSCVNDHLENDGRFIIDYFNPRFDFLVRDPSQRYPVAEYPDPDGQGQVVVTENNIYEAALQINHVKWYYRIGEQAEIVEDLDMRIFYPQELDALLKYNGFAIEAKFGSYDEIPFESSSTRQLIVCHRRE